MPIRTAGGTDSSPPNFNRSVPYDNEEGVETNTVVTFVFDEPMDTDTPMEVGDAITWTGLSNPELFSYLWSPDGLILFCHYTPGLPTSTLVQWALNPSGSVAKLRDAATNDLPEGNAGQFTTNSTSNLGVSDVANFELSKGKAFFQDGDVPTDLGLYFGEFFVDMNGYSTVSSVDLGIPGGAVETLANRSEFGGDEIEVEADYAEKADLDQIFPNGDYVFTMHTFHDGEKEVTLTIGPDDYPNAPTILNFSTTQAIDSSQPFTMEWGEMVGGITSVIIPANTLPPGRGHRGRTCLRQDQQ